MWVAINLIPSFLFFSFFSIHEEDMLSFLSFLIIHFVLKITTIYQSMKIISSSNSIVYMFTPPPSKKSPSSRSFVLFFLFSLLVLLLLFFHWRGHRLNTARKRQCKQICTMLREREKIIIIIIINIGCECAWYIAEKWNDSNHITYSCGLTIDIELELSLGHPIINEKSIIADMNKQTNKQNCRDRVA